jgi:hypothetical protein
MKQRLDKPLKISAFVNLSLQNALKNKVTIPAQRAKSERAITIISGFINVSSTNIDKNIITYTCQLINRY